MKGLQWGTENNEDTVQDHVCDADIDCEKIYMPGTLSRKEWGIVIGIIIILLAFYIVISVFANNLILEALS